MTNLRMITAGVEPITLETARLQVRKDDIGTGIEDDLLRGWITSARESAEEFLGMLLTDAVYEYRIDELPSCGVIWLPVAPIGIVSSVTYLDRDAYDAAYTAAYDAEFLISANVALATAAGIAAGTAVYVKTLDPTLYVFDNNPKAPAIRRAYQATWPTMRCEANAVVITFQGYYSQAVSPPLTVPQPILSAMQLMISDLYQYRGETIVGRLVQQIPMGAQHLMQPYRLRMGV